MEVAEEVEPIVAALAGLVGVLVGRFTAGHLPGVRRVEEKIDAASLSQIASAVERDPFFGREYARPQRQRDAVVSR